jgi:hypothetical protein
LKPEPVFSRDAGALMIPSFGTGRRQVFPLMVLPASILVANHFLADSDASVFLTVFDRAFRRMSSKPQSRARFEADSPKVTGQVT